MIDIEKIKNIDDKNHVALLDTSSISFMQGLKMKGISSKTVKCHIKDINDVWDAT